MTIATLAEKVTTHGRRRSKNSQSLFSLAVPILLDLLKVRSTMEHSPSSLRQSIDSLLLEFESAAQANRYPETLIRNAKFALVAFIDESALSDNLLRGEWEKFPLQLQHFGEHLAGVRFYEKLTELEKNPESNSDVIEIYYACMLLGYRGQYKVFKEEEFRATLEKTRNLLQKLGRLQSFELSPHWKMEDQPEIPKRQPLPVWAKVAIALAGFLVITLYLTLYFALMYEANKQILR
jgi:type VI secretion system protein ImpK